MGDRDQALQERRDRQLAPTLIREERLALDGFNVLLTIEAALSGGVVLLRRDGCLRDIASVHGTYRQVDGTVPAIERIALSHGYSLGNMTLSTDQSQLLGERRAIGNRRTEIPGTVRWPPIINAP